MDQHQTLPISALRNRLDLLIRGRLWLQVLIGLLLGIGAGLLLSSDAGLLEPGMTRVIAEWLALPGRLFLALIALVLIPLVVASIVRGMAAAPGGEMLRRIGGRFALLVLGTTVFAAVLGVALAEWLHPGTVLAPASGAAAPVSPVHGGLGRLADLGSTAPDHIAGLIPNNLLGSVQERDMMAVVVAAILLGVACATAERRKVEPLLAVVDGVLEVSLRVIGWAMALAPLAVFGLTAKLVANAGIGTVIGLGAYLGTVLLGLAILLAGNYVLVVLVARRDPRRFALDILPAQLLAFSTSSSAAVIPLSIETAEQKLGVSKPVAELVIPLGATVNMAGTAFYQTVAIMFLAQMSGIELPSSAVLAIVVTLVAATIGAPGTPGVSVLILSATAARYGIPEAGLVLILGADRLLDMARTVVNVTGDLTAALILGGPERKAPPAGSAAPETTQPG
ncbi:MAG: dicarboxylate/amino acid:cation symporter [Pseudomonadota bacterium]|nr:dicarboxylate/amino acid:cation symporter [Pseudomonadota bacterium]